MRLGLTQYQRDRIKRKIKKLVFIMIEYNLNLSVDQQHFKWTIEGLLSARRMSDCSGLQLQRSPQHWTSLRNCLHEVPWTQGDQEIGSRLSVKVPDELK